MVDQQKYIIENKDGTIIIVSHLLGSVNHPTIEDVINSWGTTMRENVLTITPIDDTFVFPDREFRNAWIKDGDQIGHDLNKAKELSLDTIRRERTAVLELTDSKYVELLSKGQDVTEVVNDKVILRNVTNTLKDETIQDIEHLKQLKNSALEVIKNIRSK